jgi:signal transduction histidine kinase
MSAVRPRLKLHYLLLAVNLAVLWLPLLGLEALRLYDSALIRQTESELIAQGAFVAASYRAALARLAPQAIANPDYGLALSAPWRERHEPSETHWRPRPAQLDLAEDPILPPPPETTTSSLPPDQYARLAGEELQALLHDVQITTLAGIAVADVQGTVVATTGPSLGRSLMGFEEVQLALKGEMVSRLRQRIADGSPPPAIDSISRGTPLRVFVAAPILLDHRIMAVVLLWRTPIALSKVLHGKRYHLLLSALLLLGTVIAMSMISSLTVVRPLQALIRQTQRAIAGEKGAVTPLTRPVTREIADLSQAVTAMAAHLEQRADYIRTFAAHVSHEFKTPLAAIRGAVELLHDHIDTMTTAERERFLHNLDHDAARLDRLVRRLLELARADVMQPVLTDQVELATVIARLAATGQSENLQIMIDKPIPAVVVPMAEEILESILSNLLDNARQHGGDKVTVTASCSASRAEAVATLLIEISDNGPGISVANRARVFEPFFTTARGQGGTGLGLAVVKSLLSAHGGTIQLAEATIGTRLQLHLPIVRLE